VSLRAAGPVGRKSATVVPASYFDLKKSP